MSPWVCFLSGFLTGLVLTFTWAAFPTPERLYTSHLR